MSANAVKAGQAYVEIATKQGLFESGLAKVQKSLKSVSGIANQIGKQTSAGLGQAQGVLNTFSGSVLNLKSVIASSVVVVGLKSAVSQFLDAGKLMQEAMKKTGMSAEALNQIGFGSFISTKDVAAAFRLNTALGVMGDAMEAVQNVIGGALAPGLTALAQFVTRNVNAFRLFLDQNRNMLVIAAQVAAGLAVAGGALVALAASAAIVSTAIGAVVGMVGFAASVFGVLAGAIGFLLSPVGIAIAGVVALGTAIVYYSGAGSAMISYLGDQFGQLLAVVMPALNAIKTALMSGQFAAAGKVLMTSLELAFRIGTRSLYGIWVDSSVRMLNVWTDVTGGIQDAMGVTINWLFGAWDGAVTYIAKKLLYLYSLFDKSIDYEKTAKGMDDDFSKRAQGRNSDLDKSRAERERIKAERIAGAEANKGSFDNRIKELGETLKDGIGDIGREAVKRDKANAMEQLRLPQMKDINQLFSGTAAVGTSSGFAADKFGSGMERQAVGFPAVIQQLKKSNELLERQNQIMAKNQQSTYDLPLGP
jgi:hypothetical protein